MLRHVVRVIAHWFLPIDEGQCATVFARHINSRQPKARRYFECYKFYYGGSGGGVTFGGSSPY